MLLRLIVARPSRFENSMLTCLVCVKFGFVRFRFGFRYGLGRGFGLEFRFGFEFAFGLQLELVRVQRFDSRVRSGV